MKTKKALRNFYQKILSNLSKQSQAIVIFRKIIAQQHTIWKQYLMEMFKSIGKPIDYPTANKIEHTIFYKVKGFFPNDSEDAMEDVIEGLIKYEWFENLDPGLTEKDIEKLLYNKTKQLLINKKNKRIEKDKTQELYDINDTNEEAYDIRRDSPENFFINTPQEAIQIFEKEQSDSEWDMILKDFLTYLTTVRPRGKTQIPLDNIFEDYFIDGYTLTEIAEDFDVSVTQIKNKVNDIGKEFMKFIKEKKVSPNLMQELRA